MLTSPLIPIAALLVVSAWARGGTVPSWQWPFPLLGVWVLIAVAAAKPGRWGGPRPIWRALADPATWAGTAFLVVLCVQWWNAGRFHYFDPIEAAWGYTPPRIPWLTSAITPEEAAEMLRWFFPAWALILAFRSGAISIRRSRILLIVLAVHGAILALFGIAQQVSGTDHILWIEHLPHTRFFASFGYENHAGSYFILTSSAAVGLLIQEILNPRYRPRIPAALLWGALFACNFAGANLSYSRAAMLLVWTLAVIAMTYTLWQGGRQWKPSTRVNVALAGALLVVVAAMAVEQVGGDIATRELASLHRFLKPDPAANPNQSLLLGDRVVMLQAAARIWQDYPWFGSGGWGYRYLMPYELPDDDWEWSSIALGKANVHNDFMQFLAEFGAVGVALMLIAIAGLAGFALPRPHEHPAALFVLVGVSLVILHSLVDLPFRSPAVMYAWIAALGCSAVISKKPTSQTMSRV